MDRASDPPKRSRGRPRLSDDDKKRRNMTFRVRDELRDAVEEIAAENGRSLSEQVEFFVEKCVMEEARFQYGYSTDGISPAIKNAISTQSVVRNVSNKTPEIFRVAHHGSHQSHHSTKNNIHSTVDAVELASVLLKAVQHGAIEALGETLGSDVLDALNSSTTLLGGGVSRRMVLEQDQMHVRCAKAEAEVEQLRKENRVLKEAAVAVDQAQHSVDATADNELKGRSLMFDLTRAASDDFLEAMALMNDLRSNPQTDFSGDILEKAHSKFTEASKNQLKCFYMLGAAEVCGGNLIERFRIEDRRQEEIQQQGCILASRIVKSDEEPFPLMLQFSERWRMFGAADARERFEGSEELLRPAPETRASTTGPKLTSIR